MTDFTLKKFPALDLINESDIADDDGYLVYDKSIGIVRRTTKAQSRSDRVTSLPDITSLSSLNTAALVDGQQFWLKEWWPDTGVGGGPHTWKAGEDSANHNGGTIKDPRRVSVLDVGTKEFNGYHTAVSGNTGCFVAEFEEIPLTAYGAYGDGVTINTLPLRAFFNTLASGEPKQGFIPGGDYLTNEVGQINVNTDVSIRMARSAIIRANTDIQRMLWFRGTAQTYRKAGVKWSGGIIDNSDALYESATLSGEGLVIQELGECYVEGVHFRGPADYTVGKSDSGLLPQDCLRFTVKNCIFSGQNDEGIYAKQTDFLTVEGCHFVKCWSSIRYTSGGIGGLFTGNTFSECRGGMLIAETDGEASGEKIIVSNNLFYKMRSRAVDFRLGRSGDIVSDNLILDWGYNLDGTRAFPEEDWAAINLIACEGVVVSDNVMAFSDYAADADHLGIRVGNFSFGGSQQYSMNNVVKNNYFNGGATNMGLGIEERDGNEPNSYLWNTFRACTVNTSIFDGNSGTVVYDADSLGDLYVKRYPYEEQGVEIISDLAGPQVIGRSTPGNGKQFLLKSDANSGGLVIDTDNGDTFVKRLGVEKLRIQASTGQTAGTGSAGPGNQWVELSIGGARYKLLHDGVIT